MIIEIEIQSIYLSLSISHMFLDILIKKKMPIGCEQYVKNWFSAASEIHLPSGNTFIWLCMACGYI